MKRRGRIKGSKRAVVAGILAAFLMAAAYAPVAAQKSQASVAEFEQALQDYRRTVAGLSDLSWDKQQARFEALRDRFQGTPWAARAEALSLDCMARAGQIQRCCDRGDAIAHESQAPDWILYAAGRALRTIDPKGARQAYERLLREQSGSVLVPDALMALAELTLAGAPATGAGYLRQMTERFPDDPLAEKAVYLLATKGPVPERAGWLRAYRERFAGGPHRSAVALALAHRADLSGSERLSLAGDLLEEAEYGMAARLLEGLSSPLATFRQGRAAWRLGRYDQAIALLKRAMTLDHSLRSRALITMGQLEEKRKRPDAAATQYRAAAAGQTDEAQEALGKLGALYRKGDDEPHAIAVDRDILARFGDSELATEARWRFLWRAYRAHRYDEARQWAQRMGQAILVKVEGPGGAYWLGRLQERAGERTAALATYREIVARKPRSYYGWRAKFRLAALTAGAPDPGYGVHPVDVTLPGSNLSGLVGRSSGDAGREAGYVRAIAHYPPALRELTYLGMVDPARRYAKKHGADSELEAWLALSGGHYAEAISLAQGTDPYLSYPLGYYPFVRTAATMQGIDPLLLASLVKQESMFEPTSRSWIGAVGLAQLMPDTAGWVGRHVPGPARSLADPFWNLKLGAYYLGWLEKQLDNRPMLAVAAYNAGPHAVKRWLAANPTDDWEAWIELIPFPETRHYVKKVYGNLWTYQQLYGAR